MENWRVLWAACDLGYQVLLMNRTRVARRVRFDNELGEPLDALSERARQSAVELALDRRVPLDCVGEDRSPDW